MLSYIYRLAKEYQELHGHAPNLVYLNRSHLNILKLQLGNPSNLNEVLLQLGFDIALSQSLVHPSVAYAGKIFRYDAL